MSWKGDTCFHRCAEMNCITAASNSSEHSMLMEVPTFQVPNLDMRMRCGNHLRVGWNCFSQRPLTSRVGTRSSPSLSRTDNRGSPPPEAMAMPSISVSSASRLRSSRISGGNRLAWRG